MNNKMASIMSLDKCLLGAVLILLFIGLYVIYSGSSFDAARKGLPTYYYALKHFKFMLAGFVLMGITTGLDHSLWYKLSRPIFYVVLLMLLAVIVYGSVTKGAARWLSFSGYSLQPSELMKVALFAYLSRRFSEMGDDIADIKKGLIAPGIIVIVVATLIMLQPNFSMTLMMLATSFALFCVAGVRVKTRYLLGFLGVFVVGCVAVGLGASYRLKRIEAWLHPEEHLTDGGYQLYSALISLGNGGLTGTGIGQGTQKLGFLPEAYKDVIFSVLGEEHGFVGTTIVLLLFGVVVWRGLVIAQNAQTRFSKYFALCLTCTIALNAIFHICVNTGLMPTTGQPLPFISFGGSNLIVSMASVGILLNISRSGTGRNIVEPRSIIQDVRSM